MIIWLCATKVEGKLQTRLLVDHVHDHLAACPCSTQKVESKLQTRLLADRVCDQSAGLKTSSGLARNLKSGGVVN